MTNTIGDGGTNFEESAATMTVPGKEMKDGEGTIGMTGETILNFNVVPAPSPTSRPTPRFYSVPPYLRRLFLYKILLRCSPPLDRFL